MENDNSLVIRNSGQINYVNAYGAIPHAIFGDPSILENLLDNSQLDVNYRKEIVGRGFFLENKSVRIGYFKDENEETFSLNYLNICPGLFFRGIVAEISTTPEVLDCDDISLVGGGFHFPDLYFGTNGLSTSSISIIKPGQEHAFSSIPGKEEWFDRGKELLQRAADKYNLRNWYERHISGGALSVLEPGKLSNP